MEEEIFFLSQGNQIHGLFEKGGSDKGVVVTHPHPQYGGDMHNPVVASLVRVFRQKGYTTLRFNFRGVGKSQGHHDNGIGEQTDVLSALSFLREKGIHENDLAGYSFGAWINAQVADKDPSIRNMVMVSPPVGFVDFKSIGVLSSLKLVVTGGNDEIASPERIKTLLPTWNTEANFVMIPGADHFFWGHQNELEKVLYSNLTNS